MPRAARPGPANAELLLWAARLEWEQPPPPQQRRWMQEVAAAATAPAAAAAAAAPASEVLCRAEAQYWLMLQCQTPAKTLQALPLRKLEQHHLAPR